MKEYKMLASAETIAIFNNTMASVARSYFIESVTDTVNKCLKYKLIESLEIQSDDVQRSITILLGIDKGTSLISILIEPDKDMITIIKIKDHKQSLILQISLFDKLVFDNVLAGILETNNKNLLNTLIKNKIIKRK